MTEKLLPDAETLFIININADENPDKQKQSVLELADRISDRHHSHYLWLLKTILFAYTKESKKAS